MTATPLPPYPPNSVAEKAAWAAYATLRELGLIPAGDWSVPHRIGAETQRMYDLTHIPVSVFPAAPGPGIPWLQPATYTPVLTCSKCGVRWEGAMGYSCPDTKCPVQRKATC